MAFSDKGLERLDREIQARAARQEALSKKRRASSTRNPRGFFVGKSGPKHFGPRRIVATRPDGKRKIYQLPVVSTKGANLRPVESRERSPILYG